jgi:hypothetical protein
MCINSLRDLIADGTGFIVPAYRGYAGSSGAPHTPQYWYVRLSSTSSPQGETGGDGLVVHTRG